MAHRIHERERRVGIAQSMVETVILGELTKHDLTDAEVLRVLNGALHSVIGDILKVLIRVERHGDRKKPGGWE